MRPHSAPEATGGKQMVPSAIHVAELTCILRSLSSAEKERADRMLPAQPLQVSIEDVDHLHALLGRVREEEVPKCRGGSANQPHADGVIACHVAVTAVQDVSGAFEIAVESTALVRTVCRGRSSWACSCHRLGRRHGQSQTGQGGSRRTQARTTSVRWSCPCSLGA